MKVYNRSWDRGEVNFFTKRGDEFQYFYDFTFVVRLESLQKPLLLVNNKHYLSIKKDLDLDLDVGRGSSLQQMFRFPAQLHLWKAQGPQDHFQVLVFESTNRSRMVSDLWTNDKLESYRKK